MSDKKPDRWITIAELESINKADQTAPLPYDEIMCHPQSIRMFAEIMKRKHGYRTGDLTQRAKEDHLKDQLINKPRRAVPMLATDEMPVGVMAFLKDCRCVFAINLLSESEIYDA